MKTPSVLMENISESSMKKILPILNGEMLELQSFVNLPELS